MLHGTLPYAGTWEYKPPGAFIPYALALLVTRSLVAAPVSLGLAVVWVTALLAYLLARRLDAQRGDLIGVFASFFFILMSPEEDGLTGDVELLIAPFGLAALLLLYRPAGAESFHAMGSRYFFVGLLAAAALQMKLTALPTSLFLLGMVVFVERRRCLWPSAFALLGFLLPVLQEIVLYAHAGYLHELYDVNIGATLRRLAFRPHEHAHGHDVLVQQVRLLAPALEFAAVGLFLGVGRKVGVLWTWFFLQILALVLVGEYDYRQFIGLVPVVALLGAFGFDAVLRRFPKCRDRPNVIRRRAFLLATMLLCFALHDYYTVRQSALYAYHHVVLRDRAGHEEVVARTADALVRLLHDDRSVFFVNASPLLYDVTWSAPPTRYAFTHNLFDRSKWAMLGFNGSRELQRIVAQRPHYILATAMGNREFDPATVRAFQATLTRMYTPIAVVAGDSPDGGVFYRLRGLHAQSISK
jgi:hypothetical protein